MYAESIALPKHQAAANSISTDVPSSVFAQQIDDFLRQHPDGVVVHLDKGVEIQRFLLPSAAPVMAEQHGAAAVHQCGVVQKDDGQHLYMSMSVLNERWCNVVPEGRPVLITVLGLLTEYADEEISRLVRMLGRRFPKAWLIFDEPRQVKPQGVSHLVKPMKTPLQAEKLPLLFSHWLGYSVQLQHESVGNTRIVAYRWLRRLGMDSLFVNPGYGVYRLQLPNTGVMPARCPKAWYIT